jgi:hypothetical protein
MSGASVIRARSEHQLISVGIENIEIAHAVIVVLRQLNDVGAARGERGMDGVDITHKSSDVVGLHDLGTHQVKKRPPPGVPQAGAPPQAGAR